MSPFKKFLSALAIAAIFSLGVVGALSVIPHAHGHDFNHSKHETCPVYQFGLHGVHANEAQAAVFAFLFLFCFFLSIYGSVSSPRYFFFTTSRAPPALSLAL